MAITSGNNTITVSTRNRVRVFNKPTTSVLRKNGLVTLYEKSYNGGLTKKYDWDLETAISDGYATLDLLLDYLTQQLDDTGAGAITSAEIISALGYTPYSSANPTGFITASSLVGLASEAYVNGQGFLISSDLTPYLTITSASTTYYPLSGNPSGFITASALSPYLLSTTASTTYQQILVSGTNLKTINGSSLLGSGDITISGGGSYTAGIGLTLTGSSFSSNLSTGISGGQSAIGGTASGNNLTLSSTSHATKGKILFGTSAYDEVNNRLGIGTATPLNKLDVYGDLTIGDGAGAALKYNSTVAGGGSEFVIQPIYSGTSIVSIRPAAGSSLAPALRLTDSSTDAGGSHAFSFGTGSASLPANAWNFFSTITGNANTNSWPIYFGVSNPSKGRVVAMTIDNTTNVGIGQSSPTAYLHLKAGTATANTAPLKFTTGTNTTVAVAGQIEYDNTFHLTNSDATRRHIVTAPNTTKVTASAPYTNDGYIVVNIAGTDFKILTTA